MVERCTELQEDHEKRIKYGYCCTQGLYVFDSLSSAAVLVFASPVPRAEDGYQQGAAQKGWFVFKGGTQWNVA